MKTLSVITFAVISLLLFLPAHSKASVLTGPAVTADTTVDNSTTRDGFNFGGLSRIAVGRVGAGVIQRGLIRFDLTSISGTVSAAELTFYKTGQEGSAFTDLSFDLYAINSGNENWVEGISSGGADVTDGSATWNYKSQTGSASGIPWTSGAGIVGPDVGSGVSSVGSFTASSTDVNGTAYTVSLSLSAVQNWIDNPSENGGLLIVGTGAEALTGDRRLWLANSEYTTVGYRPSLDVTAAIPEPSSALLVFFGTAILFWFRRTFVRS